MYNLVWELTRAAMLFALLVGVIRLGWLMGDYVDAFKGRRLFAVKKRWYHKLTRRSK